MAAGRGRGNRDQGEDVTETGVFAEQEPRADRGARFQPWLLSGAALTVTPAMLVADASPALLALLLIAVAVGGVAWVAARRGRLSGRPRQLVARAMAVAALVLFVLVLLVDAGRQPADYLILAAALSSSIAATRTPGIRWGLQLGVVVAVGWAMRAAGRPLPDVLFGVALVAVAVVLADGFVRRMRAARQDALRAADEAARRAELLDAVRGLAGSSVEDAAIAVCRSLVTVGFDGAVFGRVEGDVFVPLQLVGTLPTPDPTPRGAGMVWSALEANATRATHDYGTHPDRIVGGHGVRAAVVTPVRLAGMPMGALIAVSFHEHGPTAGEIEIVEVLASHLGGVVATEGQRQRQRQLLDRRGALDRMRRGLLDAVSDEVRDPLTILRGAGQILSSHAERIGVDQRNGFLERMIEQADDLRAVVEVLLDFSRSQAQRQDPTLGACSVAELLAPLSEEGVITTDPPLHGLAGPRASVEVDAALVRSAVELLVVLGTRGQAPRISVIAFDEPSEVELRIPQQGAVSELVHSLVAQLVAAGGGRAVDAGDTVIRLPRVAGPPNRDYRSPPIAEDAPP